MHQRAESVFEYTYLLFWNSFWTIAPVIGIGLFDRLIGAYHSCLALQIVVSDVVSDDRMLEQIPELYRYGREGYWFGLGSFIVYMFDGVYQVSAYMCP